MADKAKTPTAPSRPSLSKMREIKSAATAPSTTRAKSRPSLSKMQQAKQAARSASAPAAKPKAAPKVVGKSRSSRPAAPLAPSASKYVNQGKQRPGARPSLAAMQQRKKQVAPKPRNRSATGSAARIVVAGRHVPKNHRYKTGWWRPVRQSWMTDEVWAAVKAINRFKNKSMSKGLSKASLGEKIWGKEGPGHAGYGTGQMQKWADKMLRKGVDPHFVDLTKWFAGAAAAVDYHMGERTFADLMNEKISDPDHFMNVALKRMKDYIPELKKVSASAIDELAKHHYYTAQYGPDGRAK